MPKSDRGRFSAKRKREAVLRLLEERTSTLSPASGG